MSDQHKSHEIDKRQNSPAVMSRREMLKLSGNSAAVTALVAGGVAHSALAQTHSAKTVADLTSPSTTDAELPVLPLGSTKKLKNHKPQSFSYPDQSSPCTLVKLGKKTPGGVGRDSDIVAYSILCSHRGCPVSYESDTGRFKCPCHFSLFDAEKSGQLICGQATTSLPRILLDYDANTEQLSAVGVEGLIYGRIKNRIE